MGQSVLDTDSGKAVFYPDGISSDEIEKSMSNFNNGTISEARPDWYTQYIKEPLQRLTGNPNLDPIMTARAAVGGVGESLQPLTPFNISPTQQEKQAFQDVSPAAHTLGGLAGQIPPFVAIDAVTGGVGGALEGIPLVAKAMQGLNAVKEAGVLSEQGLKVAGGAARFGAVTGEYGGLSSVSEQKQTYGNVDWHDVAKEAAKQAGFGLTTGGAFSYLAKPLAELGTADEVIAHSSKMMMASGSIMAAQAAANGASPRDVMLNFGMGSIMAGLHLHGEIQEVRDASIQEMMNHQARYILGQTGGDEQAALRVAEENTMNHGEDALNESNMDLMARNEKVNGLPVTGIETPAAKEIDQRVKLARQFNDPYAVDMLDYLAQYIPAKYVAGMDSEERLALANGPWQNLRDISAKYESGQLPEKPAILNEPPAQINKSAEDIERDAGAARGIARNKNILDEIAKSKTLTESVANKLAEQMVEPKEVENAGGTGKEAVKGGKQAQGVEQGKESGVHLGNSPTDRLASQPGKEVENPALQNVEGGQPKVAKSAQDVNKEFVKQGFDEISDEEKAKFNPIRIKEQEEKVAELISDPQKVQDILDGKQSLPSDIQEQVFFNAVSKKASAEKDFNTGIKLANSPIAKRLSLAAQSMRAAQTDRGLTHDPIKEIQEANKVLKEKSPKDVAKQEEKIIKNTKKTVQDSAPKKSDWDSFLESIKC